jgi:hypothetical protein
VRRKIKRNGVISIAGLPRALWKAAARSRARSALRRESCHRLVSLRWLQSVGGAARSFTSNKSVLVIARESRLSGYGLCIEFFRLIFMPLNFSGNIHVLAACVSSADRALAGLYASLTSSVVSLRKPNAGRPLRLADLSLKVMRL